MSKMEEKKTFKSKVKKFVADHQMEISVAVGAISAVTGMIVGTHIRNKRLEKVGWVNMDAPRVVANAVCDAVKTAGEKSDIGWIDYGKTISSGAKDILSEAMYAECVKDIGEAINDVNYDYIMLFGHGEKKQ